MAQASPPEVLPASRYLQERLQERRARHVRPRRVRQSDFGPLRGRDDDIFLAEADEHRRTSRRFDSSPLTGASRGGSDAGSTGPSRRRTLGIRDLNEQMDRLTKENFALKLELDHRRDHAAKLQDQVDSMHETVIRAERIQEEHAELLRINTELVEELEKRDRAVEEAMDIICDLEDKVTDLDARSVATRPSTAKADSGYAGTETQEQVPPSSPPGSEEMPKTPKHADRNVPISTSVASNRLLDAVSGDTPTKARRERAVMSQPLASTHALRSVYLETTKNLHPVQSFASLLSRRDQRPDEEVEIDSPRLSVLSESSFRSMYSPAHAPSSEATPWRVPDGIGMQDHSRQDSINRVSRWMDQGSGLEETPSKSNDLSIRLSETTLRAQTPPAPTSKSARQFQSLDDAAVAAPPPTQHTAVFPRNVPSTRPRTKVNSVRPTSFAGPIFGDPLFPPTPESASTRMLRTSQSSIHGERSLLDVTPAPVKSFEVLEPGVRTAPRQMRSSVELKTAYMDNLQHREASRYLSSSDGEDDALDIGPMSPKGLAFQYEHPDSIALSSNMPSRPAEHANVNADNVFSNGFVRPGVQKRGTISQHGQPNTGLHRSVPFAKLTRADTSPSLSSHPFQPGTPGPKSPIESVTAGTSPVLAFDVPSPRPRSAKPPTDAGNNGNASVSHSGRSFMMSPARQFGYKTQRLFRRLSGGQLESPRLGEPRTPREKSPLPTLTSTPSSEYANTIPREIRRPSTAEAMRQPLSPTTTAMPRPPSSRGRRPSLQQRTRTDPPFARTPTSSQFTGIAGLAVDLESIPPPQRRNSVHQKIANKSLGHADAGSPVVDKAAIQDGTPSGYRSALSKRRGSIKDAVIGTALRSWR